MAEPTPPPAPSPAARPPLLSLDEALARLLEGAAAHRIVQTETVGSFDDRDQIFQEYFPLPRIDGTNLQIGTFTAAGTLGGTCVRADRSPVLTTHSDIWPLRIVPDEEFLRIE